MEDSREKREQSFVCVVKMPVAAVFSLFLFYFILFHLSLFVFQNQSQAHLSGHGFCLWTDLRCGINKSSVSMQIVFGYSGTFRRETDRERMRETESTEQAKSAGLLASSESYVWCGPSLRALMRLMFLLLIVSILSRTHICDSFKALA